MPNSTVTSNSPDDADSGIIREDQIEYGFIGTLQGLKYTYRRDITDRASLERNFREKFESLNQVRLTDSDCPARQRPPTTRSHPAESERSDGQFARLLDEIVVADVFTAAKTLRAINSFTRDDCKGSREEERMRKVEGLLLLHSSFLLQTFPIVWHTTGSGKTLTSFKASTLLKLNDHLYKCVFVVDRKDLDRQTREDWSSSDKTSSEGEARRVSACSANQFNRFQEGCVEENTNIAALVRSLLSEDYADKVIVTTIQKLGLVLDESSKRNKQRKKNYLGFTRTQRFVIDGASQAIQHYYSIPCASGWNLTQNK